MISKRLLVSLFFGLVGAPISSLLESLLLDTDFNSMKLLINFVLFSIVGYVAYRGNKNN